LISSGAEVNVKDDRGDTPLSLAVMQGSFDFFKLLVSAGADVNEKNGAGNTLLFAAEIGGQADIVNFLTNGERNLSSEDFIKAQEANKNGMFYVAGNDYENAINEFSKAIRLDSNNADFYQSRGMAFVQNGQMELGIEDFTESIRLKPTASSNFFRGGAYLQLGKYDLAISDTTESIRLDPNYYLAYMNRGIIYRELKENDKAKLDFEKVLTLNPEAGIAAVVNKMLGEILNIENQEKNEIIKGYFSRGQSYHDDGNYDLAIEEFTKAIKFEPNNPGLYGCRGYAYKDRGLAKKNQNDYDLAIADFTKSLELYPTAFAHCARGILYGFKNDRRSALTEYNIAIQIDPNYSEAYLHRGVWYGGNNDLEKAIADWEAVLRIDPNNYAAKSLLEKIRGA
jgi:tetratricopeptide (TPR) repeat protein